jgi:D-aminopeptidase
MAKILMTVGAVLFLATGALGQSTSQETRPRAAALGIKVGVLPAGALDAITDVSGVEVGQTTIIRGENIRTGVTAVFPHGGNLYQEKVPGGIFVGNGFGKLAGSTQVDEMGDIETPIVLTSTTSVPRVADAVISYMLALQGNEQVLSINPVVGETNDGYLSDIRGRHISEQDVFAALKNAKGGPVDEGAVGAGTGTVAFGWKGGIGTASRRVPASVGGYTVGVLVQTNFGGVLTIDGAPVGQELNQYYLRDELRQSGGGAGGGASAGNAAAVIGRSTSVAKDKADGSCMIVVATDAPLDARNLKRLAARALLGLGRAGSSASNGSGDYAIAFSTAAQVRIHAGDKAPTRKVDLLTNDAMSPLFLAAIEATEEAIYNSMLKATTTTANGHTVKALPIDKTVQILKQHRVIP